ncbi:MAG: DUF4115 domain-containing protein [Gammaproteobacteria bacterium]|nr:DUF4115 domain-containing protein [Gammaproteobacteria bacterium]
MNTSQSEVFSSPAVELDLGPGQRLKNAREASSLSLEEVATHLHLDIRTISNLEADNYDVLPAPTFVRGYLRSYARLLNIAPEPLIDGFDRRGLEPPPLVADISTSEETKASDPAMRIATLALALVMLIGVGLWGKSQLSPSPLDPLLVDPSAQTEGLYDAVTQLLPEDGPKPEAPNSIVTEISQNSSDHSVEPQAPEPNELAVEIAPPLQQNPVGAPGIGRLVLKVRSSSWIEVYDRDGERLYYNTGRAGDTIDVKGSEPLQVLLGFADGVRVEYNGALYEPTATRGLARFTLGEG